MGCVKGGDGGNVGEGNLLGVACADAAKVNGRADPGC